VWEQGSRLQSAGGHRILFGHVQEDTSLEASLAYNGRALCIGSGGETAFDLLLGGAKDVVAIDVNPAQSLLVRLKSAVFRHLPPDEINRAFTLDARPAYKRLQPHLPREVNEYFDHHLDDLASGLIHSGQIDRDLRKAMRLFQKLVLPRRRIEELIVQATLDEQARYFAKNWNTARVRLGLNLAFKPFVLKRVFGREFGSLAPKEFGEQVKRDLAQVLTTVPLEDNPYVWQTFLGEYPSAGMPPWLTEFGHRRMAQVISKLGIETGDVADWMIRQPEPTLGLVCLSNVLDASKEVEKLRMIDGLSRTLIPGGKVVVRSLFDRPSGLAVLSGGRLAPISTGDWMDRSVICRHVELYRWLHG
jgi:S-adenosylmethionine:diacylglycerol 3-amino-3-carboxypropyl transferase